jgi:hypothetical protein
MKKETPPLKKLDEQTIREAAEAALRDLQLDAGVESVTAGGDDWRVQFTADYGQFSDSFRDQFGKENSFELVREKIKRHILRQQQRKIRAGARIRRGRPERRPPAENLFEAAVKTIGGVASQTAGFAGEIINQAMSLPQTALTALETAGQTLTEAINPAAEPSSQPAAPQQSPPPLARVRIKMDAAKPVAKVSAKSSSVARQASSKKASASKKAATKSSKRATAKPAAKLVAKSASKLAAKTASKPAAKSAKTASKSAAKKLPTKKSRAKKSSRKR